MKYLIAAVFAICLLTSCVDKEACYKKCVGEAIDVYCSEFQGQAKADCIQTNYDNIEVLSILCVAHDCE